jgi:hypothetical protein
MTPVKSSKKDSGLVTHSICSECADNLDFQLGVSLKRYLDSLKIPVIALDGNGQFIGINSAAIAASGKAADRQLIEWPEKIYECAHARLPQGCRTAIHCSGCAIRFAVTDTYNSGSSTKELPAHLNHCSTDLEEKVELLISTDRIDNIVFLRMVRL